MRRRSDSTHEEGVAHCFERAERGCAEKAAAAGLVHIEITEGSGERIPRLREQIASLERCAASLGKPEKGAAQAEALTPVRALAIAGRLPPFAGTAGVQQLPGRPAGRVWRGWRPWGEVHPAGLRACAGQGVVLVPYEIPAAEYAALGECARTAVSGKIRRSVKCLARAHGRRG